MTTRCSRRELRVWFLLSKRRWRAAWATHRPDVLLRSHRGSHVNRHAVDVLDYAPPTTAEARWPFFVGGVVVADLLSLVLLSVLRAGGPIFPFTVLFALSSRSLGAISRCTSAYSLEARSCTLHFVLERIVRSVACTSP